MVHELSRSQKTLLGKEYANSYESKRRKRVDDPARRDRLFEAVAAQADDQQAHMGRVAEPGKTLRSRVVVTVASVPPTSPPVRHRIILPQVDPDDAAAGMAWSVGADGDIARRTPGNIPITRRDVRTLLPGKWLNDEIMNAYIELVNDRRGKKKDFVCLPTYFFQQVCAQGAASVERMTFGDRATVLKEGVKYVVCPINVHGNHWAVLLFDLLDRNLQYFDSLGGDGNGLMQTAKSWLKHEYRTKLDKTEAWVADIDAWPEVAWDSNHIPRQTNNFDCGVFALMYIRYLTCNGVMDFTQSDMPTARRLIMNELREFQLRRA